MSQEPVISISEASQVLGVSEATLRQWTDEGRIKVFITPGGHRRYSRAELRKFMTSHQKTHGIKDLVVELEDTAQHLREIGRKSLSTTTWYDKVSKESREHLAYLGRQLLNSIIKYITEPSKREDTIAIARGVGYDLGETLSQLGLPLTDSVEVFILHRDPIMNAVTHLIRKRDGVTGRVAEAIPLVAHVMDEALVSLVEAHQQYRNGVKSGSEGRPVE